LSLCEQNIRRCDEHNAVAAGSACKEELKKTLIAVKR
jgi:hypothetical protein